MTYHLYAVREGQDSQFLGTYANLESAKIEVDSMEADGSWPEAFEAMTIKWDGQVLKRYFYTDKWEDADYYSMRKVERGDIESAIRGLQMHRIENPELYGMMEFHQGKPEFASKVIAEAARSVLEERKSDG